MKSEHSTFETKLKPKDYRAIWLPLAIFIGCFLLCLLQLHLLDLSLETVIKDGVLIQVTLSSFLISAITHFVYRYLFGYKMFSLKIPRKK